jgi:hypothetical protein
MNEEGDVHEHNEPMMASSMIEGTAKVEREWDFGGRSFDGKGVRDSVPVCKHLLACLLGERWGDVLGKYMKVREVNREEMAGLGGEG